MKIEIDIAGLPLRKLESLLGEGWQVNGVHIQRVQDDGTVKHGAVTVGGMVLWWQHEQERVIAPGVRELLAQAVELLDDLAAYYPNSYAADTSKKITPAMREAMAAPGNQLDDINVADIADQQQDPVAWGNMSPGVRDGQRVLYTSKALAEAYDMGGYQSDPLVPLYTAPQPAPQQKPDASKQWEPEFDAICPKQEALAKQFCEDIAQTHGGLMDPVRLLEMAEALYCAERDESIDPGSSDVVESVARNINAGHDGKYCSDLWPVTADAIRNFVGSDFCSLKFGREDQAPDENDQYLMSAHDLISAFRSWKDFELQLVTQQTPDALHLAAMDLARKQSDRIAELEAEAERFRRHALNERAARQALEQQLAARVLLQADMFWNSEDAEPPHDSIECFLNDRICNDGLEVGEVFMMFRAKKLPDVTIMVTAIDLEKSEAEYKVIEAAHGITKDPS